MLRRVSPQARNGSRYFTRVLKIVVRSSFFVSTRMSFSYLCWNLTILKNRRRYPWPISAFFSRGWGEFSAQDRIVVFSSSANTASRSLGMFSTVKISRAAVSFSRSVLLSCCSRASSPQVQ
jgi:hypothetical protein